MHCSLVIVKATLIKQYALTTLSAHHAPYTLFRILGRQGCVLNEQAEILLHCWFETRAEFGSTAALGRLSQGLGVFSAPGQLFLLSLGEAQRDEHDFL